MKKYSKATELIKDEGFWVGWGVFVALPFLGNGLYYDFSLGWLWRLFISTAIYTALFLWWFTWGVEWEKRRGREKYLLEKYKDRLEKLEEKEDKNRD